MITQIKSRVTTAQLLFLSSITGVGCLVAGLLLLGNSYSNKLFPNTYINSINVSGMTLLEGISALEQQNKELPPHQLIVHVDDISLASSSAEMGYRNDYAEIIDSVYTKQHKKHPILTAIASFFSYFKKSEYTAPKTYDKTKLAEFLTFLNQKVELTGKDPSIELKISGSAQSIVVFAGKPGRSIDQIKTAEKITATLQTDLKYDNTATQNQDFKPDEQSSKLAKQVSQQVTENMLVFSAEVASTSTLLDETAIAKTVTRAKPFVGKKVTLVAEDKKFHLSDQELISFLDPLNDYFIEKIDALVTTIAEKTDRPPQNAVFDYNKNTLKVTEFVPHRDGLAVDTANAQAEIISWLKKADTARNTTLIKGITSDGTLFTDIPETIHVPLQISQPEVTLAQTNELGINERIGFGESYYHHSIPNRIHNVGITADKISYTIVSPGKEFSFNKTLGEVSARTGYKSAYVISGGRTVLGDGGGVCQVSSTLFRAVLDAGLDITKRLQHSYRVSYYELNSDPGFDATVYSGEVDFRFKNDTPGHIIIVTHNDPDELHLNIEIYGTDDGRTAEIHDYKQWGFVGAPAPEYYPTPDLPTGVKKQVDWSVSGIKTEFTHTVKDKNGTVIHNDTYYSNYRPWSAKYMVGI